MAKIETRCTKCGKYGLTVDVKTSVLFGQEYTTTVLQCGHRIIKKNEKTFSHLDRDEYWNKLYPFQQKGVEFIEKSGFRCLVADEMGLGKTVQALITIRYHRELLPVLYIVKSAVKYQWQQQILKWLKDENDIFSSIAQVVENGNSSILPVKHVIISMDMLEKFRDKIVQHDFKTIIIDESQNFKSLQATRTNALTQIITEANIKNIICLTGTPILNRASEFFTTLNILRPEQWRFYGIFYDVIYVSS